jgi:hypothetical protein
MIYLRLRFAHFEHPKLEVVAAHSYEATVYPDLSTPVGRREVRNDHFPIVRPTHGELFRLPALPRDAAERTVRRIQAWFDALDEWPPIDRAGMKRHADDLQAVLQEEYHAMPNVRVEAYCAELGGGL